MQRAAEHQPVFSVEQHYTLVDPCNGLPSGWSHNMPAEAARAHYCGLGTGVALGRDMAEAHVRQCLHAGIDVKGVAAGSGPGQWSYKVGPLPGIDVADHLWASRYLLLRASEKFGVIASLEPRPAPSDPCSPGCNVKFSTLETRVTGIGLLVMQQQIARLQVHHLQHMMAYGQGNLRRFLGRDAAAVAFTCAVGDKRASVMIPTSSMAAQCGYYIDRRPAPNMDPYLVTMLLVSSALAVPLPISQAAAASDLPKPLMSSYVAPKAQWQQGRSVSRTCSVRTLDSEDVLIEELCKLDPDTPPNCTYGLSAFASNSEFSDGTSPETESCLASAANTPEQVFAH